MQWVAWSASGEHVVAWWSVSRQCLSPAAHGLSRAGGEGKSVCHSCPRLSRGGSPVHPSGDDPLNQPLRRSGAEAMVCFMRPGLAVAATQHIKPGGVQAVLRPVGTAALSSA